VSVAHQRESLTGAGVEADGRDSLLFHFICLFFVRIRQADDADVRHRVSEEEERERERERGKATRVGGCRRERCGREKSFNVKVTWAHAHRIDHPQMGDKAEAVRTGGREAAAVMEKEDPLALAGCSPVGIRCISRLHLVGENI